MTVTRDSKGRIVAGSGPLNPTGRPNKDKEIKQLIMDKTKGLDTIFKTLNTIMNSRKASNRDRIAAATKLLEYAVGKPSQQITANIDTTGDIKFRWAETEEEAK